MISNDGDLKMPIQVSARDVTERQFPEQVVSPKGARLIKPETW